MTSILLLVRNEENQNYVSKLQNYRSSSGSEQCFEAQHHQFIKKKRVWPKFKKHEFARADALPLTKSVCRLGSI